MAEVIFEGLEELLAQLRAMPSDLTEQASEIVDDEAELARSEIYQGYPRRTGDLREGMRIATINVGQFGAGVEVSNTSPLAFIFENGTQARHTMLGANRGSMPPGKIFVPAVVKHRRAMYQRLSAMLTAYGLEVSGSV